MRHYKLTVFKYLDGGREPYGAKVYVGSFDRVWRILSHQFSLNTPVELVGSRYRILGPGKTLAELEPKE